jgi:hypothetical protein
VALRRGGGGKAMAYSLYRIGAKRIARRPDIVEQLRCLLRHPKTLPNLASGSKEGMPVVEEEVKKR